MKNKEKALKVIAEKLKNVPWAIFSGTAVEIYTEGKRMGNDIDIVVPPDMIDETAKRFNANPVLETRGKERVEIINDYHVETEVEGVPVEFVGKTEKFIINEKEYIPFFKTDLLQRRKKVKYKGVDVFLVPREEILVQKIIFNRSGQWQDEEDLKLLLKDYKIDESALELAFKIWGVLEKEQEEITKKLNSFYESP